MSGLDWDGWREVDLDEWNAAIKRGGIDVDRAYYKRDERDHWFLPVVPIPDDAIGMCPNGHVMVRGDGSFDGWWHSYGAARTFCNDETRTIEVIGTRSKP